MPEGCSRILERKVQKEEAALKQAQPFGQKMDQARARCRRAVESGEEGEIRASAAGGDAGPDRPGKAHAGVMPVPQVYVSLVTTLEALTGIIENIWKPRRRPTT